MNKQIVVHHVIISDIIRNIIQPLKEWIQATTHINLNNIMLSEKSQSQKTIHYMIPFI